LAKNMTPLSAAFSLLAMADASWKAIAITAVVFNVIIVVLLIAFFVWAARSDPDSDNDENNETASDYINQKTLAFWNALIEIENEFMQIDFAYEDRLISQECFLELAQKHKETASAVRALANRAISLRCRGVDRRLQAFGKRRAQWLKDVADSLDAWSYHYLAVEDHNDKHTGFMAIAEGAIRGALGDIFGKGAEANESLENLQRERNRISELTAYITSEGQFLSSEREAILSDLFEKYGWSIKQ
jgi:hypothetical protein